MTLRHLRSSTADKRPQASGMAEGQLAINTASGSPGLFFKDSAGNLVKVGPVHVGSGAPNASPASGGTAGNSLGEQWLDTSGGTYVFKVWDGAAWRSEAGEFVNTTGDTMTGALGIIAGSASTPGLFFSGDANSGLYSPGADQVAISTGGNGRLFVDASGAVGIGLSPTVALDINAPGSTPQIKLARTGGIDMRLNAYYGNSDLASLSVVSAHPLAFHTFNIERLRITSAGLVGIGNSAPSTTLDVNGNARVRTGSKAGSNTYLTLESSDVSNSMALSFANSTNANWQIQAVENGVAYRPLILNPAGGNVGIGTTSPGAALDVRGGSRFYADSNGLSVDNIGRSADNISIIRFLNNAVSTELGRVAHYGNDLDVRNLTANSLTFGTNNTERARIDSSGRLLIGTSSAVTTILDSPRLQIFVGDQGIASFIRGSANEFGPNLHLVKSRNTAPGSRTIVQSGDELGSIFFIGDDGVDLDQTAARIFAAVDGTPGSNDMPGRLVFATTADGASSPTERMRINSLGRVGIGNNSPSEILHVEGNLTFAGTQSSPALIKANGGADNAALLIKAGATSNVVTQLDIYSGWDGGSPVGGWIAFKTQNTERARVDSSGRLLVGSSTAAINLASGAIQSGAGHSAISNTGSLTPPTLLTSGSLEFNLDGVSGSQRHGRITGNGDTSGGAYAGGLDFEYYADKGSGYQWYTGLRITSGGTALVGGTTDSGGAIAAALQANGGVRGVTATTTCFFANRRNNDGNLVEFYQADTIEGTISVSGTTVSYNGAHLSRWSQVESTDEHDISLRPEILRGTVLSNIDEMCEWGDEENEQLNRMKVSDVEGDKNVSGVFQAWDDDDDTYTNDFYCAMTGDFIIRIGAGVTVERGDLLISAGDGTAKPQDDDIIRSKTIAKVTSTNVSCTYDDGSYCVPCVLMAC